MCTDIFIFFKILYVAIICPFIYKIFFSIYLWIIMIITTIIIIIIIIFLKKNNNNILCIIIYIIIYFVVNYIFLIK